MGRIIAAYGIRGWVRVQPFTGSRDALLDYPVWWLDPGDGRVVKPCRVIDGRLHGDGVVACLESLGNREEAAAWNGAEVQVPREALPPVADNEVYWSDLIGCSVVNRADFALGVVESVRDNGAQPVLSVASGAGGAQMLIPFVPAIVDEVDLETSTIRVDWEADY